MNIYSCFITADPIDSFCALLSQLTPMSNAASVSGRPRRLKVDKHYKYLTKIRFCSFWGLSDVARMSAGLLE